MSSTAAVPVASRHAEGALVDRCMSVHAAITASATAIRIVTSKTTERVSSHVMPDTIPFSTLQTFQKVACSQQCGKQAFVGSINGKVVLSVNTAYLQNAGTGTKKRARDTTSEDVERAMQKVKASKNGAGQTSDASFEAAQNCIQAMLRIKGTSGESVIESWAISIRNRGEWGHPPGSTKPSVVVAFRMAAGVGIPLLGLCSAVRACRDGFITVDQERVAKDFQLPMSEQGLVAQGSGQSSVLVVAAVPDAV